MCEALILKIKPSKVYPSHRTYTGLETRPTGPKLRMRVEMWAQTSRRSPCADNRVVFVWTHIPTTHHLLIGS